MSHTASGQTTSYTWDVAGGLPVALQDGANTYVYGLDLISATDGSGAQTYFLYDGLGSTTDLVDGSGAVNATYSYDVFGAIRSQTGTSPNYWLFTGEQRDTESALYYLRARYYDPATGRFLSQDPAGAGHPYAYVENNPVNLVDPIGLWPCPIDPTKCVDEVIDAGQCALDFPFCPVANGIGELTGLIPEGTLFTLFGKYHISYQLVATCFSDPVACAAAFSAFPIANEVRNRLYPNEVREGTPGDPKEGDAFQHCFWSGLITLAVGPSRAENVTRAYEAYAGNPTREREYDMANNKRGREFAQLLPANPASALALQKYC